MIAVLAEVVVVETERVSAHETVGLASAAHGDSEAGNPPHERTDQRVEEVLVRRERVVSHWCCGVRVACARRAHGVR